VKVAEKIVWKQFQEDGEARQHSKLKSIVIWSYERQLVGERKRSTMQKSILPLRRRGRAGLCFQR
jgi:hypothetical protein